MKKICRQCEREVRRADFYRHPTYADGLMAICKSCHRSNVRANRKSKADYYRDYDKRRANLPHRVAAREAYSKTPEGRAAAIRSNRVSNERYPSRRAARIAVGNALRDGKLDRQPCEVCGERAQAHHDDYSKPLDVRWLCPTHHAEWHKHNTPKCPDQEAA